MSSSGPAAANGSLPPSCLRPRRTDSPAAPGPFNTAAAAASPCPGACCAPDLAATAGAPWAPAVLPGSCAGDSKGLSCGNRLELGLAPTGLSPGEGGVTATATDCRRRASLAAWPARVLAKDSSRALGVGCKRCGCPGWGCTCGAAKAALACPDPARST